MSNELLSSFERYFAPGGASASLVPAVTAVICNIVVWLIITSADLPALIKIWTNFSTNPWGTMLAVLVVSVIFACLLDTFNHRIVQFFEGYWPNWPGWTLLKHAKANHYEKAREILSLASEKLAPEVKKYLSQFGTATAEANSTDQQIGDEKYEQLMDLQEKLMNFPPTGVPLLPTRLGNALLAGEEYSRTRYNIDPLVFWFRLIAVLPDQYLKVLDDLRKKIDWPLNFCLLFAASGVCWTMMAIPGWLTHGNMLVLIIGILYLAALIIVLCLGSVARIAFFICGILLSIVYVAIGAHIAFGFPLSLPIPTVATALAGFVFIVLSLSAYEVAVDSAADYGDSLGAAFDTHRIKILESMGYKCPDNIDEEKTLWLKLSQAIFYGKSAPSKVNSVLKKTTTTLLNELKRDL